MTYLHQPKSKKDTLNEVLETYDLNNHVSKATRSGKKLIDHIISNIPANKILHSDVLPCPTISDHDAPISLQTCLLRNSRQDTNT